MVAVGSAESEQAALGKTENFDPFTERPPVMLGDQLPFHWRELKQLQRRQFATFGLSEDVYNPRARDSFAELVE
jgi:hypothetical protein